MSDTHGDIKAVSCALEVLNDADLLIHCGDMFYHGLFNMIKDSYDPLELSKIINSVKKPIIYARGNCDSEVDQLALDFNILDPVRFFFHEDNILYIHHGDKKGDNELQDLSRKFKFNIAVSGHTHIPRIERKNALIFINPGSPSLPKGGFPPTVGEINFNENMINIINIDTGEVLKTEKINI
jgi:putative phosphoesterase